jgi:hypothetical protein
MRVVDGPMRGLVKEKAVAAIDRCVGERDPPGLVRQRLEIAALDRDVAGA